MSATGVGVVALAAGLELAFGEPLERTHPVAWFGRAVAWTDREWSRPRLAGVAVGFAAPLFAAGAVSGAVALAGSVHAAFGVLAAGRNASGLSAGEVRSAAVESAAENLADGLVAPLGAFAVLAPASIALATGAAAWVKAVNTLDSMLGYPSKPHGTASARLDDLVMWVPARASAIIIALAARRPAALTSARRFRAARW
jgi:adenosylcobinamide-phosphate synthase